MGEQGRTSWQIGMDQPENLVIGLFVRDVAGLKTRHTWLPHCAPGIARANGEGSAKAAHEWDLWWDRSISNYWNGPDQSQEQLAGMWWREPDFESLQSAPALQEIVARHFDNARQWAAAMERDLRGRGDARLHEALGDRDDVVEDVLLVVEATVVVPRFGRSGCRLCASWS